MGLGGRGGGAAGFGELGCGVVVDGGAEPSVECAAAASLGGSGRTGVDDAGDEASKTPCESSPGSARDAGTAIIVFHNVGAPNSVAVSEAAFVARASVSLCSVCGSMRHVDVQLPEVTMPRGREIYSRNMLQKGPNARLLVSRNFLSTIP